jgi:hypothetical protein
MTAATPRHRQNRRYTMAKSVDVQRQNRPSHIAKSVNLGSQNGPTGLVSFYECDEWVSSQESVSRSLPSRVAAEGHGLGQNGGEA